MSADDTTNAIEGEAEVARDRISATIDELQDRLDPRRIVGNAVESVQSGSADLLNSGLGLARAHPAALAAAGLAVGLAVLGSSRLRKARVDLGDGAESYSDYDDDYGARDRGERFAVQRQSGGGMTGALVTVVVGLGAGALIGALFPETESERRLLGASADRFTAAARAAARQARDEFGATRAKAGDVASHARSAVQSVVDAAKSELGQQH